MDTCKHTCLITFFTIVVLLVDIRAIDATDDGLMDIMFASLTPLTKTLIDVKRDYDNKYSNEIYPKRHDVDYSFIASKKSKREVRNMKKHAIPLHLSLGTNKQKHDVIPNVSASKELTRNVVPFFITPKQNRHIMTILEPKTLDIDKHTFPKDTEDIKNKESTNNRNKKVSVKDEASKTVNHDHGKDQEFEVPVDKNDLLTVHPNVTAYKKDNSPKKVTRIDRNQILNTPYKKIIKTSINPYFEESLTPESKNTDSINTGTQKIIGKTKNEVDDKCEDVCESPKSLDCAKTYENNSNHAIFLDKPNITFDDRPTIRSLTLKTSQIPVNLNTVPSQIVSGAPENNKNGPNSKVIENQTAEEVFVPPSGPEKILQKPYTGYRLIDTNSSKQWHSLPLISTAGSHSGYPRIYNGEITNIQNTDFYNFVNPIDYQRYPHKCTDISSTLPRENQGITDQTWTNTRIFSTNSPIQPTIEINIMNGDKKMHCVEILPSCNQNTRPIIAYSNGYYDNQNIQPLAYLQ